MTCSVCNGSGREWTGMGSEFCEACNGSGVRPAYVCPFCGGRVERKTISPRMVCTACAWEFVPRGSGRGRGADIAPSAPRTWGW